MLLCAEITLPFVHEPGYLIITVSIILKTRNNISISIII